MTSVGDRYELEREVGRGGSGVVWLAQDTLLSRQVAIKRIGLLPGATDEDLDRVRREARVSAMLSHEHVVLVYDLIHDDRGSWLVMEYVESQNLAALVRDRGPLPPDRVAGLVTQAVEALSAAHRSGIVHRDVKPSNLLVTPEGRVKLSDFGIARVEADQSLTLTGALVGSPAYLAPEVAAGQPATPSSDMWGLGATVFHALEGQAPYQADGPVVGTLYRIVNEEPPVPEHAGWLTPMVRGLMTHDPAARWTADRVAAFLEDPAGTAQETQQILAVPPSPAVPEPPAAAEPHPAAKPVRRRASRGVLLGAGALGVLLVVVVGFRILSSSDDAGTPGAESTPSASGSPSASPSSGQASSATLTSYAQDYVDTVVRDPRSAFDRLTPRYQEQSGGIDGYLGFWGKVRTARVQDVRSNPGQMTVSYTVDYVFDDGNTSTESVVLDLVRSGGGFLIDGASSKPA